ncbi:Uncharacterised protein [Mycobacteroides abscessus subsp. abscessus]|nr:Uncharacterised protein [Mycobacteroides abscessus subsp. abscessus]
MPSPGPQTLLHDLALIGWILLETAQLKITHRFEKHSKNP